MIRREEGFTLVEVLVAATILMAGVLTALTAMGAARKLTLVSERRTSILQRAQSEFERVKSLPYSQMALTSTSSSWSTTSSDYTYVNASAGTCPSSPTGPAPTYQPDHNPGGSTATESLVINGCTYTVNGSATTPATGTVLPSQPWSDGRLSGTIYDFITWASDPTCSQSSTPGSVCATANDYKRITIVVTLNGVTEPSNPVIVSGYVADPNQNSPANLLKSPTTSCTSGGQTVSCSDTLAGTPLQYFPCDSSYSSGSCGTPSCSGNNVHQTLVSWLLGGLLTAPAPDLLGSNLPSGACTSGASVPTPPCFSLDLGAGCQGLKIIPSGNSTCGSPPSDNTKSHSWVTPGIPSGTTINLNGSGSMTAYLMSGSGVAVNVTVCLGVYVVPGGLLSSLTGNLLQTPIGATVSANVTAQAAAPTPVSFNFNTGAGAQIVGGGGLLGLTGLPRIEVVVWLAATASTNVSLAYDQAQFATQFTLMSS